MKTLVAFYSRSGDNRKLAEDLAKRLDCDMEEIRGKRNYKGPLGYLMGGYRGVRKKLDDIEKLKKDASKYGLVVFSYPVWAGKMPPAMRTYVTQNRFKEVALASVSGGGESNRGAVKDFEGALDKKAKALVLIKSKRLKSGDYALDSFIKNLS